MADNIMKTQVVCLGLIYASGIIGTCVLTAIQLRVTSEIFDEINEMKEFLDVTPVDLAGGYCYQSSINPCKSTAPLGAVAYG